MLKSFYVVRPAQHRLVHLKPSLTNNTKQKKKTATTKKEKRVAVVVIIIKSIKNMKETIIGTVAVVGTETEIEDLDKNREREDDILI